ncbi:hypothetical protein PJK54_11810 [Cobetia sp. MMG027]|uniref:hypothetical protein n=1 Tax=Cobetia sp. MMG027 TaxID=3021980 RepID=UPI0022FEFE60|nr:hypothetical protein [Cobetia sp. MMG027]MDA5564349.1 hypothetical protein [Cobetia sp. MMG027]
MIITHTVLFCDFNGDMHDQRFITRQKAIDFALGLIENGHVTPDIYDQAGRNVAIPDTAGAHPFYYPPLSA